MWWSTSRHGVSISFSRADNPPGATFERATVDCFQRSPLAVSATSPAAARLARIYSKCIRASLSRPMTAVVTSGDAPAPSFGARAEAVLHLCLHWKTETTGVATASSRPGVHSLFDEKIRVSFAASDGYHPGRSCDRALLSYCVHQLLDVHCDDGR